MNIFSKAKAGLTRIFGVKEVVGNYESVKDMAKGFYDYNTHKVEGQHKYVYVARAFVEQREREFRNLFFLFAAILLLGIFYFFFALFHHLLLGALLIFCFCLFIASLCFRYHFWWFQIRKRKLGCSFEEWKDETLHDLSGRNDK